MKYATKFALLTLCNIFVIFCTAAPHPPEAKQGVLDLRTWNWQAYPSVALQGEWAFYWKKLLYPQDFTTPLKPDFYFSQPCEWNRITIADSTLPAFGWATYRLTVLLPAGDTTLLSIKSPTPNSTFQVFVDNKMIYAAGKVGTTPETSVPARKPSVVSFDHANDTIHIVLHVSNFNDAVGGLWSNFSLGSYNALHAQRSRQLDFDIFIAGCILIIGLYHFGLFALRRKDKSALYFGFFCLIIGARTLFTGETYISTLYPDITWIWLIRVEYMTFYLSPITFGLFLQALYPHETSKFVVRGLGIATIFFAGSIIFAPSWFFCGTLRYFQVLALVTASYVIVVIINAFRHRRQGIFIFMLGFIGLFSTLINDILYSNYIINSVYLISLGLLFLIFSQAYLLSARFSQAFVQSEKLSDELSYINKNLESIVRQRTAEIEQQNEEIKAQAEYLESANEAITKQKADIELAHKEIKASINYARRIQKAVMPNMESLKTCFSDYFVYWQPRNVVSGDFYWFRHVEYENREYWVIAVADCTGHGVPGAFVSMLGVSFLSESVQHDAVWQQQDNYAANILNLLREHVKKAFLQTHATEQIQDGMDIALCVFEPQTCMIHYAGAHNPISIVALNSQNQYDIYDLKAERQPIGFFRRERPFVNQTVQLQKGDKIYMYTDGMIDQMGGEHGQKMTRRSLRSLLLSIQALPMTEQRNVIEQRMKQWQGNYKQVDDMLIIGLLV